MHKHLQDLRKIMQLLDIDFTSEDIRKIVVTKCEEQGFGKRGASIDELGQVRDRGVQVLALTMLDPGHSCSKAQHMLTVSLWRRVSSGSATVCLRAKTLCTPSFVNSTISRVQFSSYLHECSDVKQSFNKQVNGHQPVHCRSLPEKTQSSHIRHRKRGGRCHEHQRFSWPTSWTRALLGAPVPSVKPYSRFATAGRD